MATENNEYSWDFDAKIRGIYLETSALKTLNLYLDNAEFEELIALAKELKIPIYVPKMCLEEIVEKRIEVVGEMIDNGQKSSEKLAKYFDDIEPLNLKKHENDLLKSVKSETLKLLKKFNISIIDTPENISLKTIIEGN